MTTHQARSAGTFIMDVAWEHAGSVLGIHQ